METNPKEATPCGQYPASGCSKMKFFGHELDTEGTISFRAIVTGSDMGCELLRVSLPSLGLDNILVRPERFVPATLNPSHHDGAAPAPSVDGVVQIPNKEA